MLGILTESIQYRFALPASIDAFSSGKLLFSLRMYAGKISFLRNFDHNDQIILSYSAVYIVDVVFQPKPRKSKVKRLDLIIGNERLGLSEYHFYHTSGRFYRYFPQRAQIYAHVYGITLRRLVAYGRRFVAECK